MKKREHGFVLALSLIFLVIITLLGIYMFNGFTVDQKIAGNYREKARATDAAQAALNYTETWLAQASNTYPGSWNTGIVCNGVSSAPVVCSNALNTPATLPWPVYSSFTPQGISVAASGANMYSTQPVLYIQYLGSTSTNPPTALYMGTATATGGNANATAVIQTIYQVQATSIDVGGG